MLLRKLHFKMHSEEKVESTSDQALDLIVCVKDAVDIERSNLFRRIMV